MSDQVYSKNHYVPKFYLKNWATDKKLFVYNTLVSHKDVPIFQEKNIRNIAYVKNIYAVQEEKTEYNKIENWFNENIEIPYSLTQTKIIKNEKLSYEDYCVISKFVFVEYMRTPKYYIEKFPEVINVMEEKVPKSLEDTVSKISNMNRYDGPKKTSGSDNKKTAHMTYL